MRETDHPIPHSVPRTKLWDRVIVLECLCGHAVDYPGHPDEHETAECESCGRKYTVAQDPIYEAIREGDEMAVEDAMGAMRVFTKALVARLGGDVILTKDECDDAAQRSLLADPLRDDAALGVRLAFVEGEPVDVPRYAEGSDVSDEGRSA